jgi:enterochelin esterase-like enzyme
LPEPQSTLFFLLMMAFFGAMVWWLVVAKQLVFRVLAACLAFIPAMTFGIAAVNKYYDYYQNWNAAIADITSQGVQTAAHPAGGPVQGLSRFLGRAIDTQLAAQRGLTLRISVHGRRSDITRSVYVYLPPQYFAPAYRTYRFPAIELIHGFPGQPQDWITVLDVTTTLQNLISAGQAKPAVLVMPDANGGRGISLQCLNQVNGPQDATFLAQDLPGDISRMLRVRPPGASWGIAGYSEGGYCAANLGLRYATAYGYAAVLSGYFKPSDNQLTHPFRLVQPFGHNHRLERLNTPADLLQSLPAGTPIPHFWLGVGSTNRGDVRQAEIFDQLLQLRQPAVTLKLVPGGGHTMFTWRALLAPMLSWMTPDLATRAAAAAARDAKKAAARARKAAQSHISPARAPGHAGQGADAARRAGPGAGHPPGKARPSSG